jgi:hypothetical protein
MGAPIEPDYDFSETSQALLGDVLSAVSRVEQHLRKFLVHGDRDAALQQLLGGFPGCSFPRYHCSGLTVRCCDSRP